MKSLPYGTNELHLVHERHVDDANLKLALLVHRLEAFLSLDLTQRVPERSCASMVFHSGVALSNL